VHAAPSYATRGVARHIHVRIKVAAQHHHGAPASPVIASAPGGPPVAELHSAAVSATHRGIPTDGAQPSRQGSHHSIGHYHSRSKGGARRTPKGQRSHKSKGKLPEKSKMARKLKNPRRPAKKQTRKSAQAREEIVSTLAQLRGDPRQAGSVTSGLAPPRRTVRPALGTHHLRRGRHACCPFPSARRAPQVPAAIGSFKAQLSCSEHGSGDPNAMGNIRDVKMPCTYCQANGAK
jgi:hypothetical protein